MPDKPYKLKATRTYRRSLSALEDFWQDIRLYDTQQIDDEYFRIYQLAEQIKTSPTRHQDIAEKFNYPTNLRRWFDDEYSIYYNLDVENHRQINLLSAGYNKQYPTF